MPRRAKADRRIGALALLALGAIGLVAWRGESSALLSGRSSVGRSAFGSRATRQSLESLGALYVVPPRNDQEIADPLYGATPPTARAVAEALAIGEGSWPPADRLSVCACAPSISHAWTSIPRLVVGRARYRATWRSSSTVNCASPPEWACARTAASVVVERRHAATG